MARKKSGVVSRHKGWNLEEKYQSKENVIIFKVWMTFACYENLRNKMTIRMNDETEQTIVVQNDGLRFVDH